MKFDVSTLGIKELVEPMKIEMKEKTSDFQVLIS